MAEPRPALAGRGEGAAWRCLGADDLLEGEMRRVQVGARPLVLARSAGRLYAFHATCPHASAELCEGDLRPTYVICPLHAYRFELATGHCLKPRDGPRLRTFPVERRVGELWVLL